MSDFDFLGKEKLYIEYFRKGSDAYADKVKFFEDHKNELHFLDPAQWNEIQIDFVLCLFQIGRYERYLEEVDCVIELVIRENIYFFEGKNIFNYLLRKKASCFINLKQHKKALPIIEQLIRLDKDDPNHAYIYELTMRKESMKNEEVVKGTAIIALIAGLSLKFAETFVIDPFFEDYLNTFSTFTLGLFIIGASLLVSNEIYRRLTIKYKLNKIKNSQ
jgi:tetratricopeptide (TPR) repeat protein